MSEKQKILKKRLAKVAIIVVALLVGMGIAAFFLSDYSDQLVTQKTNSKTQNDQLVAEKKEIEGSNSLVARVANTYEGYFLHHNKNFIIKREDFYEVVAKLRKTHHLANDIKASVSAITEVKDQSFKLHSGKLVQSDIKIELLAVSDASVYHFIYDLQHKLPGLVLVSSLKIERKDNITKNSVEVALKNHTILPLVTAEIILTWLGIQPDKENKDATKNGGKS